jgi:hypothetical protein
VFARSCCVVSVVFALVSNVAVAADPPKTDRYVAPLKTLIEMLEEEDDGEQHTAAKRIRDFYPGDKCLEALPQLTATMGRQLAHPSGKRGSGYDVPRMIAEAVRTTGAKQFKPLFDMTTDKNPHVRAGAFHLLYVSSDVYQKSYGTSEEKSGLDLAELLKAAKKGAKDESPLVRKQVLMSLLALKAAEEKLKAEAVEVFIPALDDREEIKGQHLEIPATWAAVALSQFGASSKPAFEPLVKAIKTNDPRCSGSCCSALAELAKADAKLAEKALPLFREMLTDSKADVTVRLSAAGGLTLMDRAAKPAISDMAAVIEEKDLPIRARYSLYQSLRDLGPTSAAAVPVLLRRLETTADRDEQSWVLAVFAAIGPAAGEAVKPLEEWAKKVPEKDKRMQQLVTQALARIK